MVCGEDIFSERLADCVGIFLYVKRGLPTGDNLSAAHVCFSKRIAPVAALGLLFTSSRFDFSLNKGYFIANFSLIEGFCTLFAVESFLYGKLFVSL